MNVLLKLLICYLFYSSCMKSTEWETLHGGKARQFESSEENVEMKLGQNSEEEDFNRVWEKYRKGEVTSRGKRF